MQELIIDPLQGHLKSCAEPMDQYSSQWLWGPRAKVVGRTEVSGHAGDRFGMLLFGWQPCFEPSWF